MPPAGAQRNRLSHVLVTVPTFRRPDKLVACLESIQRADSSNAQVSIVAIDDHSEDSTAETVLRRFPRVRLVNNPTSLLPGPSVSATWSKSDADILVRVDDDNVLDEDCLAQLVRILESDSAIAFCGAAASAPDGSLLNVGSDLSPRLFLTRRSRPKRLAQSGVSVFDVDLVDNVYACRADLIRSIGGFRLTDLLPWSLEDALPQIILKRRGFRIVSTSLARTVHLSAEKGVNWLQFYYLVRSRLIFNYILSGGRSLRFLSLVLLYAAIHIAYGFKQARRVSALPQILRTVVKGIAEGLTLVRQNGDRLSELVASMEEGV